MADKQNMSVEEILAACRADDGDGASAEPAADTAAAPAPAAEAPETAPAPTAAAPSGPMDRSKMSVADMLAAARGEKSKPATAAKPAPKAAAKPAAKKAEKKEGAPVSSGPKDTTSILQAARAAVKPGPISKADAPEKKSASKPKLEVPPMPAKPAYAAPASPPPADDTSRRGFFAAMGTVFLGSSLAVGFTSLAVTHLLWLLGLARFMFPNILTEPPTRFKVGFPDDFAPGQVETKFKAQFGIWLVRYEYQGQLQIYALKSVCTHLGCTPNWLEGEQKFKCPCHGSGFYKDGINFEGPAPRPLERYSIRLADDGQLEVDKSRKFNEELGQWQDAASYVTV